MKFLIHNQMGTLRSQFADFGCQARTIIGNVAGVALLDNTNH
jgi:hypothetical protein